MSAVSMSSRRMPWQTKAELGTLQAALAIKKEIVKARLLQLREDEGHPDKPGKPLPVEEAAARAGVKYRTWQRWEAGDSVPYARNLSAIADAFGFAVGEFYDDSGDKAPTPSPFVGRDSEIAQALERFTAAIETQNQLLQAQSDVLDEIKAEQREIRELIAEQKRVKAENDELLPLMRAIAEGRPPADQSASSGTPRPSVRGQK